MREHEGINQIGAKAWLTIKELGGIMPEYLPTPRKSIQQLEREKKAEEIETSQE